MPFALNNVLTLSSFFMSPTLPMVHTLGFSHSMLSKHMYSMYTCTHLYMYMAFGATFKIRKKSNSDLNFLCKLGTCIYVR